MATQTRKVILVGDAEVGKTTTMKYLRNEEFSAGGTYIPTIGAEVYPITFNDTRYICWDCAGQEKLGGLRDGYYIQADVVLAFFKDLVSLDHLNTKWLVDVKRVSPDAKIIWVNTSEENTSFGLTPEQLLTHFKEGKWRG